MTMKRLVTGVIVLAVCTAPCWAQRSTPSQSVLKRHSASAPARIAALPVEYHSVNRAACCNEKASYVSDAVTTSSTYYTGNSVGCGCDAAPVCGCDTMPNCGCDGGCNWDPCCCRPLLPALAADVKCFLNRLFCCRPCCGGCSSCCDMGPSCGCDGSMPYMEPMEQDLAPPPVPLTRRQPAQQRIQRTRSRAPAFQSPVARPSDLQARSAYRSPAPASRSVSKPYSSLTYSVSSTPAIVRGQSTDSDREESTVQHAEARRSTDSAFPANPLR